ncbi:hypothetical protein Droror1_Dr00008213 [Drosera rotundifolia]
MIKETLLPFDDHATWPISFAEMAELEGRRERTRQNVERLKKEEQERKARPGTSLRGTIIDEFRRKAAGPDLQSFLRQVPTESSGVQGEAAPDGSRDTRTSSETEIEEGSQETMPRETPSPRGKRKVSKLPIQYIQH